MVLRVRAILPLAAVSLLAAGGWALWLRQEHREIGQGPAYRIGYNHNPPFQVHIPGRPPAGFSVDVLTAAAGRSGIQLEWRYLPDGPEDAIRNGKADLWPLVVSTPERRAEFYISESWMKTGLWLVRRGDVTMDTDQGSFTLGSGGTPFFQALMASRYPAAKRIPIFDRSELLTAICAKRVDAGVFETQVMNGLLLNRPPACDGVSLSSGPVPGPALEMGVMSSPGFKSVANQLRRGIVETARRGELDSAFSRWRMGFSGEGSVVESLLETEAKNQYLVQLSWAMSLLIVTLAILAWRLRKSRREAVAANRAQSDFLAVVSHEIRTPINGVLGLTDLLLDSRLGSDQREMAELIRQSGRSLQKILNDILDLSKLEAGAVTIECLDFSLPGTLHTAVNTLRPLASAKGVDLDLQIDPKIPHWVRGDPVRLTQVLLNLTSNAVKFTERGTVRVSAVQAGPERIRFDVKDSGMGIRPEDGERLFQPFVQVSVSTSRIHGGTGLGLTISKRLVQLMQGELGWSSVPGEGSVFWFAIPLAAGASADQAPDLETPAAEPLRILLAEDNPINQRVGVGFSRRLGHEVDLVENGAQALEQFRAKTYDVILMDCHMPLLDGWETTSKIRMMESRESAEDCRPIWIIALTASAMESDRDRCLRAGMNDFLAKPLSVKALEAALAKVPRSRLVA